MLPVRKAILLIATVLVIANGQCVANCVATDCSQPAHPADPAGNVPPCHRHHDSKNSTSVKPCVDSVLVVASRGPSVSPESQGWEIAVAIPAVGERGPVARTGDPIPAALPPPPDLHSTTILRI